MDLATHPLYHDEQLVAAETAKHVRAGRTVFQRHDISRDDRLPTREPFERTGVLGRRGLGRERVIIRDDELERMVQLREVQRLLDVLPRCPRNDTKPRSALKRFDRGLRAFHEGDAGLDERGESAVGPHACKLNPGFVDGYPAERECRANRCAHRQPATALAVFLFSEGDAVAFNRIREGPAPSNPGIRYDTIEFEENGIDHG